VDVLEVPDIINDGHARVGDGQARPLGVPELRQLVVLVGRAAERGDLDEIEREVALPPEPRRSKKIFSS
jgi:hypothetical protein